MTRVGVLIDGYARRTAQEAVDLALAVGLLDIEVVVLLRMQGYRHLISDDESLRGRWRTLVDYCPARVCLEASAVPPADTAWIVEPQYLDVDAFASELAACDHVLKG